MGPLSSAVKLFNLCWFCYEHLDSNDIIKIAQIAYRIKLPALLCCDLNLTETQPKIPDQVNHNCPIPSLCVIIILLDVKKKPLHLTIYFLLFLSERNVDILRKRIFWTKALLLNTILPYFSKSRS